MRIAPVTPARFGSNRFPGKPLAEVAGRSLIQRVYEIARAAEGVGEMLVATDDERIATHVEDFGGRAVLTPASYRNGARPRGHPRPGGAESQGAQEVH